MDVFPHDDIGRRGWRGFSLFEFLVVLTITGVLLGIALPSFHHMQRQSRLETAADRLMVHLLMARNHAISHAVRVHICPLASDSCGDAGQWTNGWMVFEDANENRRLDADERIIASHSVNPGTLSITYHRTQPYLYYRNNGIGWPNATFRLCDSNDELEGVQVVVRRNGRPRLAEAGDDAVDCPVTG